jgi:FkbH-like protein
MNEYTIAIAATFTAEPLEEFLDYWLQQLGMAGAVNFAPYHQVLQQLLDQSSLLSRNQNGINVLLVRLDDWQRSNDVNGWPPPAFDGIERSTKELVDSLRSAAERSAVPYLLILCPSSPTTEALASWVELSRRMEELLIGELGSVSGIEIVTPADLAALYPVTDYYDPHSDQSGHIPFTSRFFAGLSGVIARKLHALRSPSRKVLVLDCDQTLWKGVCGEVGTAGIEIDPPHRALQEFVVAQHDAGMLICLCSKNVEEDVLDIYAVRTDMPLKREHLISWRINWQPKSENLISLSEELQLGLDSFIFVDDNPVECAEVQANCSQVITLQLPQKAESIPHFLRHVWALDHQRRTLEDQKRTELYQQNLQRQQFRHRSLSFAEFLAGLELEVRIERMSPEHLSRVSQLTQRTNQFNVSSIRRSEGEILQCCRTDGLECLVVHVRDRFGDYGLVGAVILDPNSDRMKVDTFLLSCRVLGRGVEHHILRELGRIAKERNLASIDVVYRPSPRNQAALHLLETVGKQFRKEYEHGLVYQFPSQFAANLALEQSIDEAPLSPGTIEEGTAAVSSENQASVPRSGIYQWIATELCDAEAILKATRASRVRSRPELSQPYAAPQEELEKSVTEIWQEVLSIEGIGVNDNLFSLGGNSIQATQILSRINQKFDLRLPLRCLFDSPTVAGLLDLIRQARNDGGSGGPAIIRRARELYRANLSPDGSLVIPARLRREDTG